MQNSIFVSNFDRHEQGQTFRFLFPFPTKRKKIQIIMLKYDFFPKIIYCFTLMNIVMNLFSLLQLFLRFERRKLLPLDYFNVSNAEN